MSTNDNYIAISANQKHWDELTAIHEKSEFYAVEKFRKGKSTLSQLEINEVGEVAGKSLSWSRLGAKATGVDLSDKSIALAKRLGEELDIKTNFIASDYSGRGG